jgi:hypothetical protein
MALADGLKDNKDLEEYFIIIIKTDFSLILTQ